MLDAGNQTTKNTSNEEFIRTVCSPARTKVCFADGVVNEFY